MLQKHKLWPHFASHPLSACVRGSRLYMKQNVSVHPAVQYKSPGGVDGPPLLFESLGGGGQRKRPLGTLLPSKRLGRWLRPRLKVRGEFWVRQAGSPTVLSGRFDP